MTTVSPARDRLLADYATRGYARFDLCGDAPDASRALVRLARGLGLGKPFVPPLYRGARSRSLYDAAGVNVVQASGGEQEPAHPAFASRTPLELHTDGTLQPIGQVPTALLYCVRPAYQGGETLLFHATGAFLALAAAEPRLAGALLDERALARHATVDGSRASSLGPVFAYRGGEVLSRYSTTPGDEWRYGEVGGLLAAHRALAELARPPSRFVTTVRLAAGQGLLFANDTIAHGRTAFADRPEAPRCMLRALFLRRPRATGARAAGPLSPAPVELAPGEPGGADGEERQDREIDGERRRDRTEQHLAKG